jgi:hypothetical protein
MSGTMHDLPPPVPLPVVQPIRLIEDPDAFTEALDPAALILTCANCGAAMDEQVQAHLPLRLAAPGP